jgi:hypothetical protein
MSDFDPTGVRWTTRRHIGDSTVGTDLTRDGAAKMDSAEPARLNGRIMGARWDCLCSTEPLLCSFGEERVLRLGGTGRRPYQAGEPADERPTEQ